MCEPDGKMSRGRHLSVVEANWLRHRAGATVAVVTVAIALFAWNDVSTCGAAASSSAGALTVENR